MWYELLPKILNMSLTGGVVILAVLLARLLLRRAPKVFPYALWAVVLFRLLCPVSFSSGFSVFNLSKSTAQSSAVEYFQYNGKTEKPMLEFSTGRLSPATNAENDSDSAPVNSPTSERHSSNVYLPVALTIWLCGVVAMLLYSAVSYFQLRRRLVGAVALRENIYLADGISSPFVMGLFCPKIYLPSTLAEGEQEYILLHEQHHIRRCDHVVKILLFAALCVHWFNPLVWLAFVLSGRDMEMSCDEAVMKRMDGDIRADYSASLLHLATGRRIISGTPLAFGEGDTGGRIKNVLNYKKPTFWVIIAAVVACVVVAVCLMTNPKNNEQDLSFLNYENAVSLSAEKDTISTVYYPEADGDSSSISLGYAKGSALANYLDSVSWSETDAPRDTPPSPGSIEFFIHDDYRIAVYDERSYIRIRFGEETRWYRGTNDDYSVAVSMFVDNSMSVVSGGSVIPALEYTNAMTNQELKDSVFWLTLLLTEDQLTPFNVYVGEKEQYGSYHIIDAQTFESLDFMHPSGLSPQTYIFQNAQYGHSYIITLDTGEHKLCFGIRLQEPVYATDGAELTDFSYQAVYSWVNYSEDGYNAMVERAENRDTQRQYGNVQHLTPVVKLDSKVKYDDFYSEMSGFFSFTQDYDESVAFEKQAKQYDEDFFSANSLFIAYLTEGTGSNRHELEEVRIENGVLEIRICRFAPDNGDTAMTGWFLAVAIPKVDIADCTGYDAYICATVNPDQQIPIGNLISIYAYKEGDDIMHTASVFLYDSGEFKFTFSSHSSYIGHGTYTIENDRLTLKTGDGDYTYVFDMVDDTLVFDAGASSSMVWYSGMEDGSVFQ